MNFNYNKQEYEEFPNFKGGEKSLYAKMFHDEKFIILCRYNVWTFILPQVGEKFFQQRTFILAALIIIYLYLLILLIRPD